MSLANVNVLLREAGLAKLIQKDNFVGWVYAIDYDSAYVMTNDLWKAQAKGIPHNCFLVAATFDPDDLAAASDVDQEVILLRVIGSAKLPQDDDLVRTKVDHFKDQQGTFLGDGARQFDDITLNEIQFGGLECRILGTFYIRDDELWLGSDIESFSSATRLNVYRPRGNALETIVNHVDPRRRQSAAAEAQAVGLERPVDPFRIGTVRYTSTDRVHRGIDTELVPVSIQPSDFLARRTAVLGMTRTGKSNLIKQLVSVVKAISDDADLPIGQIIYDINGEYANPNQQDQGALATAYEDTIRYRMVRTVETEGFEDLRNNFYEQLSEGFAIVRREVKGDADYIKTFYEMSLDEPEKADRGEHSRWQIRVAAYRTILFKAGFKAPTDYSVYFPANAEVRKAVADYGGASLPDPKTGLTLDQAADWFECAREANRQIEDGLKSSSGKRWVDSTLQVLLDMIASKGGTNNYISGHRLLAPAVKYHSTRRMSDVAQEVYDHLVDGKIVILDLSLGDPTMRENIGRQISDTIFRNSMQTFINGETPPNIVVYIEEAHNLIGRQLDLTDTWPRLAKEGAKYRIALVYATQEVSSVHPNILANTENWFISHLNNDREIREVARFYDFADFQRSLIRAQDVGFARVKTLSGPFVVPVQIDQFLPNGVQAEAEVITGNGPPR